MARLEQRTPALTSSIFILALGGRDTAVLPRVGENSKPHHYKKGTKIEGHSEKMGFNGKTV